MTTSVLVGTVCEVVGFGATLALVSTTVKNYGNLPEKIAIHFNLRGEPNGWGSRGIAFVVPVIAAVIFVGLTLINPAIGLFPNALGPESQASTMNLTIGLACELALLAVVGGAMISFNLGTLRRLFPPLIVVIIVFFTVTIASVMIFGAHGNR